MNLLDPESQLINTKTIIKNKLKELLVELKKFKVLTILVGEYKKKTFVKSFVRVLKQFLAIQTLMKHLNPCIKAFWKKKSYDSEDWIALDVILKYNIDILNVHT